MTLTLDVTDDFVEVADFLQAVTVIDLDGTITSVDHALRRSIRAREAAASNGRYRSDDVRWHLPKSEHDAMPALGGMIKDDLAEWTILDVERATASSRWACVCRNLVVVERLDTLIDIQAANYERTSDGAQEPNWLPWKTGLRARIQPESSDRVIEHGRKHAPTSGRVYLRERVAVTTNHRIVGPDGATWKVRGTEAPEDIGQLMVVLVEKTPWPLG